MKLLAALLFFGLTTFAQGQIYRENYGWKGPVRSVVYERAYFKVLDDGTEIVERKWRDLVINFDEKGALLEQIRYDPSGNVDMRQTYFKGDKGQEVEVRESFTFNREGKLLFSSKVKIETKVDGPRRESVSYDENGTVKSRTTTLYREESGVTETFTYNSSGEMTVRSLYEPGNDGKTLLVSYRYNKAGWLMQKTTFSKDEQTVCVFNQNGKPPRCSTSSPVKDAKLTRDSYGNITEHSYTGENTVNGQKQKYRYLTQYKFTYYSN